jgi:tetratricopeptide (TPR) repeat protein
LASQQRATFLSISLGELDDAHSWLVRQSGGQSRLEILFTTIESSLLIQAGYVKEAKVLLDKALNRFPNEVELLFARVLWFDSQGDSQGSEQDLRQIILMQPEDSRALNHLGYMLADQTTRFEEALELIERAILISPDDPAIIDSLAWTQYKLGLYDEAMVNLRRAYNLFPDHEVASHLGEVLWMLGRYDEANEIWKSALEITPESEIIKEAIERLRSNE